MILDTARRARLFGVASTALALALIGVTAYAQIGYSEIKPPDDAVEYSSIYRKVFFPSESFGFLVGEQSLEDQKATVTVTHDKGATWEVMPGLARGRLMGGAFVDENTAWAVGETGTILATKDGGKEWRRQSSRGVVTADLQDAFFLTPQKGWVVGNNSTVLTTANGGRNWEVLQGGQPSGEVGEGEVIYMGVHFFDERNGIVVGAGVQGVIEMTSDGGKTWAPVYQSEDNYGDLAFANENTGWAVGKYGLVHKTTDGGKTWTPQSSGTEEDLWAVTTVDDNTVWFTGDLGSIGYTNDGGETWNLVGVEVEFFGNMKDLTRTIPGVAARGNEAWAVTDYGRVLRFQIQ